MRFPTKSQIFENQQDTNKVRNKQGGLFIARITMDNYWQQLSRIPQNWNTLESEDNFVAGILIILNNRFVLSLCLHRRLFSITSGLVWRELGQRKASRLKNGIYEVNRRTSVGIWDKYQEKHSSIDRYTKMNFMFFATHLKTTPVQWPTFALNCYSAN